MAGQIEIGMARVGAVRAINGHQGHLVPVEKLVHIHRMFLGWLRELGCRAIGEWSGPGPEKGAGPDIIQAC